MAEEQYVNIIAQTFANLGHSTCSIAAIVAELNDNPVTQKALLDHIKNGGEIGSDIQVPRTMLPEFSKRCTEAGIDFLACERNIESEFVTIMYKGPIAHRVNDIGDFNRNEDGNRVEIGSDTKRIKAISDEINAEYVTLSSKEYIEFNPGLRHTFEDPYMISNIEDKDLAILIQEQMAENFIESNMYYDEETGTYAVEFESKYNEEIAEGHLAKAQTAAREAFLMYNDDHVMNYAEEQSILNKQLFTKIEAGTIEGVIYEPKLILKPDTKGLIDSREITIKFEDGKARVDIDDPLKGDFIHETLDLSNEDDRLRLYKDLSMMKGKAFVSLEDYEAVDKMRKLDHEANISEFDLDLIKNSYTRAHFEEAVADFEKMAIKECGSVEAFREKNPNHYGFETYDKHMEVMHRVFGWDERLCDKDGNVTGFKHHKGLSERYFTKDDIEFSEYMTARILDPRISDSTESNVAYELQKEKENGKDHTDDISMQMRVADTTVVINHVAVITKNDVESVSTTDRQRFEEIKRKSDDKLSHMKIVCGSRKDIIGDTHSYDKPINPASLTAQEFADKHESYYAQGLDKEYEDAHGFDTSEEAWEQADIWAQNEHAIDSDGIVEEKEYDPFGDDSANEEERDDDDRDYDKFFDDEEEYERVH